MADRRSLTRYAWLSIVAAVATISLKGTAYFLTGSVGLLSDAVESVVNLVAALIALAMLTVAAQPPDEEHQHGHEKAEYFSSGVEGTLIVAAALAIAVAAASRLIHPHPLEKMGVGLVISTVGSVINLVVARVLFTIGRQYESITLEADARHLMVDVWTSAGVILGVALVALTGWQLLDPLVALAVAVNIVVAGQHLVRRSVHGLLDVALPAAEHVAVDRIVAQYRARGVDFHAIRTRQAASRRFVSMHVLVPGDWTVQHGHQLLEEIEQELRAALPNCSVLAHLEPAGDPASFADMGLDRESAP